MATKAAVAPYSDRANCAAAPVAVVLVADDVVVVAVPPDEVDVEVEDEDEVEVAVAEPVSFVLEGVD